MNIKKLNALTLEEERWQQTLEAMESAAQGKLVDADKVHAWLKSWGTEKVLEMPNSGKAGFLETAYLLRSPNNAEHLKRSIEQYLSSKA